MFWTFLACVALLLVFGAISDWRLHRREHRFPDAASVASEARRGVHP